MAVLVPRTAILQVGHPLARGLLGAWALTEGAGLVAHDRIRGAHLNLTGTIGWVRGAPGVGVKGDGASGYLATATDPNHLDVLANQNFSVVIGLTMPDAAASLGIIHKQDMDGGVFLRGYNFRLFDTGAVYWRIEEADGAAVGQSSPVGQADGKYHTYVVTRDGLQQYIYRDGKDAWVEDTVDGDLSNPALFGVGYHPHYGLYNPNPIWFVLFYDHALHLSEAEALHADPYQMFRPRVFVIPALGVGPTDYPVSLTLSRIAATSPSASAAALRWRARHWRDRQHSQAGP